MGSVSAASLSRLLPGLVLVVAALMIYEPALRGGWLWDDEYLFVYNPDMRTWGGLQRIWFGHTQTDYWPLTSTLLWLEVHLWRGLHIGYHLTNLALHVWSGFLIWRLFARIGLRLAWLGAFLFVIHPLAVESVAWLSEVKNAFSLPLLLLAMQAWLDFDEENRADDYRRALLFFLAAMLAKTSVIMFPAVVLLHAWWKRGRIGSDDVRKIAPFLLVAAVLGLITASTQHSRMEPDNIVLHRGLAARLACAGTAVFFYVGKFLYPVHLVPIYSRWGIEPPSALQLASLPALALVLGMAWWRRATWGRAVLFGLGFFLLNLLPVSGLVTMAYHNISWVADHFVYLPMIGLIGLTVAGVDALGRFVPRPALQGGIALICGALAWISYGDAQHFAGPLQLWSYTVQYTPDSWMVQTNFSIALVENGSEGLALKPAQKAVELRPDYPPSYDALGTVLAHFPSRLDEAIDAYQHALQLDSRFPRARVDLGLALKQAGRFDEAVDAFREALAVDPHDSKALVALGDLYAAEPDHHDDAVSAYRAALQVVPDDAAIHFHLAEVLAIDPDRRAEAEAEYRAALALAPNNPEIQAHYARFQAGSR